MEDSPVDSNPLNCHERFGQFKSTVDSIVLNDDTKLTYLKALVAGKAKNALAEFSSSGVMYTYAMVTLQRMFGQLQAFVGAHLDKLSVFISLMMHDLDNFTSFFNICPGSSFQIIVIQR